MKLSTVALLGIIAPLFYILPTIIGGLIRPGYNHLFNSISGLLASGALKKEGHSPKDDNSNGQ